MGKITLKKKVYRVKPGAHVPGDAQKIGERLEKLRNGDVLDPADVVKDARKKNSPLHKCFTWDKDAAAHKWWMEEARYIIRSIEVCVDEDADEPVFVRATVSVTDDTLVDGPENFFTYASDLNNNPENYGLVLAKAKKDLLAWKRRYHMLSSDMRAVFSAIDAL
jgi:hypothetical protein